MEGDEEGWVDVVDGGSGAGGEGVGLKTPQTTPTRVEGGEVGEGDGGGGPWMVWF